MSLSPVDIMSDSTCLVQIPESLAQRYGASPVTRRLRAGLLSAMQSPLFRRDAAADAHRRGLPAPEGGSPQQREEGKRNSLEGMLERLAARVDMVDRKTDRIDR